MRATNPARLSTLGGFHVCQRLIYCLALAICVHLHSFAVAQEVLTLEGALRLAAENHPRLLAGQSRWRAAEQRAIQAGLLPNPRLIFGAEAIPLEGDTAFEPDYLAGVGQQIPLGRQRKVSKEIAAAQRERETVRLAALENEIRRAVHGAFATALHAQASEELIRERIKVHESRTAVAAARVRAGDDIPESEEIIHAELDHEQLNYQDALASRDKAFASLALAVGRQGMVIDRLEGDLDVELGIREMQLVSEVFDQLPSVRESDWNTRIEELQVELSRTNRIPTLDLALLYRRRATIDQNSLDVEAAITIPIFSRGATTRAQRLEADATRTDSIFVRQRLRNDFEQLVLDLRQTLNRAKHTRDEILPHREQIVARQRLLFESGETSRQPYDEGRLELAAERRHYLDVLRDAHQLWARLLQFESTSGF